jgi:hypothetical protein
MEQLAYMKICPKYTLNNSLLGLPERPLDYLITACALLALTQIALACSMPSIAIPLIISTLIPIGCALRHMLSSCEKAHSSYISSLVRDRLQPKTECQIGPDDKPKPKVECLEEAPVGQEKPLSPSNTGQPKL